MKNVSNPARIARGAVLISVPLAMALTASPAMAAPTTHVVYSGGAYGSTVALGTLVTSGKTSVASLCTTKNSATNTNHAAAVTLPTVGTIGAVDTSVTASQSGTASTSTATAATAASSLLGGAITLDAVSSSASLTLDGGTYTTGGGVNLVNLVIAGQTIPSSVPANKVITIPGLARIVLNRQFATTAGGLHSWTVDALVITLLPGNPLGLPIGRIVLSSSTGSLHDPVNSLASGSAYGTTVTAAGGVVTSGKTALTSIGCGGTDGATHTNTTAGINLPSVVTTGAISSSSTSTDSPSSTNATTMATVANVNLAAGAVHADAITVTAVATRTAGVTSYAGSSASFVNLVIGGVPFPATVPANTTVTIPFVGSVSLNSVTTGSTGVQAYGLVLTLVGGTKVVIASAHAQVTAR